MCAKPVIKRVKLPLKTCMKLRREARRQQCSVSALVACAVRRDLDAKDRGPLNPASKVA